MADKFSAGSVVVASKDQVASELAEETVILSLKSGVYYGLDPVGTSVWHMLKEPRSVNEILAALLDSYDVEPEECRRDLFALLDQLSSEGLIEVVSEPRA